MKDHVIPTKGVLYSYIIRQIRTIIKADISYIYGVSSIIDTMLPDISITISDLIYTTFDIISQYDVIS